MMKWYMAVRANCQRDKSTSNSVGKVNMDRLLFTCKENQKSVNRNQFERDSLTRISFNNHFHIPIA